MNGPSDDVVDAARDRAIAQLQEHFTRGRLTMHEFEARVTLAERAADGLAIARSLDGLPDKAELVPLKIDSARIDAVFAAVARRGAFVLPRRLAVRVRCGTVDLDVSGAEYGAGDTEIDMDVRMGAVTLVVADDSSVVCTGRAVFGSVLDFSQSASNKSDRRRLVVRANVVLGSVDVVVVRRPPPQSALHAVTQSMRRLLNRH